MMSRWRASSPRHHKRHHKRQHKRQHKRHQRHHPSDPSDRGSRTPTATPDCRPPSQSHTLRGCQPAGSSGPHNESLGVRDIRSTAKKPPANWCDEAGSVLCWGRYDWKKLPKPVNKAEWCNMAPKRACARENEAYPSGSERSLSRTCMFLISVTVVPSVGSKRGSWEGRVQEGVVG